MDMQTASKPDTLTDLLERDPGRFEPVTAFRVAQASVGEGRLDVASHVGVSPAPLAVSGYKRKGGRATVRSALAGLVGALGSMPSVYNELIMREERNRSRALAGFFDLFGARMAELFADACEKYRIARRLRWGGTWASNAFVTTLLSLTGFGTKRLVEQSGVDEELILRFSGFFAARNRNTVNLRAMLAEFSGLPVEIELFRGRWLSIPPEERSRMSQLQGVQLGVNATAGAAVHDFSGGFRVVIGPLGYADYLTLAPGGKAITELFALTRLYVGSALDFDIQVVLRKEDVPFCRLGQAGDPPRLGWNSWARVAPAAKDSGDAVVVERLSTEMR
ncbi:type VI secretion system-associated protein (plasmid) [Rhizobium phaseoli]|uniref:type VI secretion system baseplate subunit TssG n=1 Tax=Rhizobium phaseoli TaxID=396 RepID=UPI0007E9E07F|nr:type VI secretion system baseplate subunit TssG [Rhizobium phaseoli]ANL44039.1 type VI secretion system-associated protein [Rhizobium phaseoli]ANL63002.1 type VI secretion system-associated protein [Rhizobium phaseoli]ANL69616.1 type VI secretion system-associated protein [Rhizobium phaseoli]ANL82414.1 type VI secretion system-associated protein [Rhizobium phaseoli]